MNFQDILNNALLDLKKKINDIIREIEIILIKLEILYDYLDIKKELPINFSTKIVYENTDDEVYQWGDFEVMIDDLEQKYTIRKKQYRELKYELFHLSKKYKIPVFDEDDSPEYGLDLFYEHYGNKKNRKQIVIEI
jgi:hypothetical protein